MNQTPGQILRDMLDRAETVPRAVTGWLSSMAFSDDTDSNGDEWSHGEHGLPHPHRSEWWVITVELIAAAFTLMGAAGAVLLIVARQWFGVVVFGLFAVYSVAVAELARREDQRGRKR